MQVGSGVDVQTGQEVKPLLTVEDVTLQYKTSQHLVTASWKVGFDVYQA